MNIKPVGIARVGEHIYSHTMHIHYFQHVPFEGPAYIENWLKQHSHPTTHTLFFEEKPLFPDIEEIDALIIMGGPMGVYDEDEYPWLAAEKTYIRNYIDAGGKVLGICLGAQLIASVLGGRVRKATHTEIGWFPVYPEPGILEENWLSALFCDHPEVFHWHDDMFEIPPGMSDASLFSEANSNQAFYRDKTVIGLQFHLEVTAEAILSMAAEAAGVLMPSSFVQPLHEIRAGNSFISRCNDLISLILTEWLQE